MEFNIRNYFVAPPGHILVFQDAQQEEYRLLAHYGNDKNFLDMVNRGEDIHTGTAALLHGVPYDEVTQDMRNKGKTTNFGLVYGLGNPAFAKALGYDINEDLIKKGTRVLYKNFQPWKIPPYNNTVTLRELLLSVGTITEDELAGIVYFMTPHVQEAITAAADTKKQYFGRFPDIKNFIKEASRVGSTRGYVKTWCDRRRHFKDPKNDGFKAPNAIIQGGCGDIMKLKLHEVNQFLKPYQTKIVNNVHDEIGTLHPMIREEILLIPQINRILCDLPFRVPIGWDIEWGYKWGEKRKFTTIEALMEELHL